MYKFGFNFFNIVFQFAPCMEQSETTLGQTRLNNKGKDITNFIS